MIIVMSSMLPLAHASVADVSSGDIPAGATPVGVAYDSTNSNLYVANFGSNTVSVVSGKTESLISTIAVGTQPYFPAFDQDNHDIYVTNSGSNSVSVISGRTEKVVATVSVGNLPLGIAYDDSNHDVYVANGNDNTVSVIDGSTNKVVAVVPVGGYPHGVAYDPSNQDVYVVNYFSNSASVISGKSVVDTINISGTPDAVAFDAANGDMYVNGTVSDSVSVVSSSSNAIVATVGVGINPKDMAYDAVNQDVYVTNAGSGTVSVISSLANSVVATITVGKSAPFVPSPQGVAYDSHDHRVYVTDSTYDVVYVLTTKQYLPTLRSFSTDFSQDSDTASCTLSNVNVGDVLFATIQSSSVAQSSLSASDTTGNSYQYLDNWGTYWGMGSAFTQTPQGGSITLTLTVGNGGAYLTLFCYDIAGVTDVVTSSQGSANSGSAFSVAPITITPDSFVVGFYTTPGSEPQFTAGQGFVLTPGTPINENAAEYGVLSSTSTTCPMTSSISSQQWGGMCFAFP